METREGSASVPVRFGAVEQKKRVIPSHFDQDARDSYMAIATKARSEAVNLYTILSLGGQSHVANTRVKNTIALQTHTLSQIGSEDEITTSAK